MEFPLKFNNEIKLVTKIEANEFTQIHKNIISGIRYDGNKLIIPNQEWRCNLLGYGEEKAVFCICDHNNKVFALEVLDERTYLNGRFVGGEYFFDMSLPYLRNIKFHPASLVGLVFTGKTRIREYVHGYVWERFQFNPAKRDILDLIITSYLRSRLLLEFEKYRSRYKDVHDRNIMFEIRDSKRNGVFIIARDWSKRLKLFKIGLQAIDVR